MNTIASFFGFLIEYLLYINLIEYLGILFFVIYGIFLILSGFKKSEDTFEEEFEMIEEMHKQRINRTPSMILGIEEDETKNNNQKDNDKYNLDIVNKYNDKSSYTPFIKKELTIIPESDISREDSIFNEENLVSTKKKDIKDEDDDGMILNKRNSNGSFGLKLNLIKKPKGPNISMESNSNNLNKNKKNSLDKKDFENEINNTEGSNAGLEEEKENENENENLKGEENEEGQIRLRAKNDLTRTKSRYALDYLDKNVKVDNPNIDTSIFGTIFFSICLSEFGDRTQLISFGTSSIFHFWGSIVGSCLALFCSCLIGVYFSRKVMKYFSQKLIDFILGVIFLWSGIQIFIFKRQSLNNQTAQSIV